MRARRVISGAGVAVTAGSFLSAFGIVHPAVAEIDCSSGVTIDADEAELRDALLDGEEIICINPGTIDLSSLGADGDPSVIEVFDQDLSLYAPGVTFDGGGETSNAIGLFSELGNDLTIDGATFSNFDGTDANPFPVVNLVSSGTLTVLNATFELNSSYAAVGAIDGDETVFGNVHVEASEFSGNELIYGAVWGYSDITVVDSAFVANQAMGASAIEKWSVDATRDGSELAVVGSFFAGNSSVDESTIYIDSDHVTLMNNTFDSNSTQSEWAGADIAFDQDSNGFVAFNTFAASTASLPVGSVSFGANSSIEAFANLFVPGEGIESAISADETATIVDLGGNVSTGNDANILNDVNSATDVSSESIELDYARDNGGPTWTMALGANSAAQDVIEQRVATELGLASVDQRGEERGRLLDAGAWDDGAAEQDDTELAATGADVTGIALGGAALAIAGTALVNRRRLRR